MAITPDSRFEKLRNWLFSFKDNYGFDLDSLRAASSDASFRRYFRVDAKDGTFIIMDAPPEKEDCKPFINISERLKEASVNVPKILEKDETEGFLLLNDLGEKNYYSAIHDGLSDQKIQSIYLKAINELIKMQKANKEALPKYSKEKMLEELKLFPEWYVSKLSKYELSAPQSIQLEEIFNLICERTSKEAQVFVHRDFHSPNIMYSPNDIAPGIIDFQDTVEGPISYDLVSLIMDARTTWDETRQLDWAIRYWEQAKSAGLQVPDDFSVFHENYEWMGLQRNLRILGVFARLSIRDGKHHYLDHIPRVKKYVHQVADRYSKLKPISKLLNDIDQVKTRFGYTF